MWFGKIIILSAFLFKAKRSNKYFNIYGQNNLNKTNVKKKTYQSINSYDQTLDFFFIAKIYFVYIELAKMMA